MSASAGRTGRAGAIRLTAPVIDLALVAIIESTTSGSGDAGSISLDVGWLNLRDGSKIDTRTFGEGNAGDIIISAGNMLIDGQSLYPPTGLFSSVGSVDWIGAAGTGGGVYLTIADTLTVQQGGRINTGTFGAGNAGNVTITARNLLVDGQGSSNYFTGILSGAFPDSTGNGGQISLTLADTLTVRNGGRIDARTSGKGDAGGITVSAGGAVAIAGGNQSDRDFFPAGFFVSSVGSGNAGDLTVTTPRLTLADGGKIQATSTQTTGGNLFINVDHLKLFDGSEISSSVAGNELSDGGNVTLNSTNIVALNDSKITAQANQGRGGNIIVNAEVFLHDAASISEVLNASSQVAGNDGAVRNNAPTTDISGSLVALNTDYLDAAGQLSPRCGTGDPDERSRFTMQGRGALPIGPDDPGMVPASRCGLETLALTSAVTIEGLGNDLLPTSVAEPPIPTTFGFNNR